MGELGSPHAPSPACGLWQKWQVCFSNAQASTEDLTLPLSAKDCLQRRHSWHVRTAKPRAKECFPHSAFRCPSIWLRDFTPFSAGASTTSVFAGNSCLPSLKVLHSSKKEDQGHEGDVTTNLHAEVF